MVKRLVFGVIVSATVFFVWTAEEGKRDELSAATLADAKEIISQVEGYEEEKDYVDSLVEKAHEEAFLFAYNPGKMARRWRASEPASFNEDTYLKSLFSGITRQIHGGFDSAKMPRHKPMRDLIRNLDVLRKELGVKGYQGI